MSDIRLSIEYCFQQFTRIIFKNRIKVLGITLALVASLAWQVRDIEINASTEEMLHENDPHLIAYNHFKEQFGKSDPILVMVEAPDLFNDTFIQRLKKLHEDFEHHVPYLSEITSLVNVRSTYGDRDTLLTDELLKNWPDTSIPRGKIKPYALSNSYYRNYVLSEDGGSTGIVIERMDHALLSETSELDGFGDEFSMEGADSGTPVSHQLSAKQVTEIIQAIQQVIDRHQTRDFKLSFTGSDPMVDTFNRTSDLDMKKFVVLSGLIIILFLILLLRRISGVVYPLTIVSSASICTMGLMALSETPISIMTTVVPSFIMAVGVADAVHILAIFYKQFDGGAEKEEAISYAMGHSGLAVLMTSVTTAAGLLSFSLAEIATIAEMGIFASIGVILALLFTVVLLPALISFFPVSTKKTKASPPGPGIMDRILGGFARVSTSHPFKIIGISTLFLVVSVWFCFKLELSSRIIDYFPEDHPARITLEHIEDRLKGSVVVEVIVDTGVENGIQDPLFLRKIQALSEEINQIKADGIYVGKVFSIIDIVKEINQALHGNEPSYYTIPQTRKEVAQNLFLLENRGAHDLQKLTDSRFSKARITLKTKWADSMDYKPFVAHLEKRFREEFGPETTITVTGIAALLAWTIPAALHSMLESYAIALVVITLLMVIMLGDIKMGLLSMFPNLLPIIMVMGLIDTVGLKLDINTLFIGSIAIGLVVDDTIHFMYNFRKYFNQTGDSFKAVELTLTGTGRAMLVTSIVLAANFFIMLTGELNHTNRFGFFSGIVIILALLADFLLAPALMTVATKNRAIEEAPNKPSSEPVFSKAS